MEDRVRDIHSALVTLHGEPEPPRDMHPVDSVINTILSQNTSDENRDAAWNDLVDEYGYDYERIETTDHEELADAIRTAGLANQKASRIQDALRNIREYNDGEYSLEFMKEMDVDKAQEWLTSINGVGDKTAGIILLFRFGKPYFPVDTHCERLAKRFELIPENASYGQAHKLLTEHVPDNIKYSFHRLLIDHGRTYCTARNADCDNRVCNEFCECEYC